MGNQAVTRRRPSANGNEVQADRQTRILAGELDGLIAGDAGDHQARAGQDAISVGSDDRPIDTCREAKVIAINDHKSTLAG